eukprot:scaffold69608_cov30-Tisochrysis_lutea.AAC.1
MPRRVERGARRTGERHIAHVHAPFEPCVRRGDGRPPSSSSQCWTGVETGVEQIGVEKASSTWGEARRNPASAGLSSDSSWASIPTEGPLRGAERGKESGGGRMADVGRGGAV